MFAERIANIQPSQTIAITTLVDTLRRQGRKILDLGAGEPDFDTPQPIKDAAVRALEQGFTKYTPSTGTLELKKAICEKLARDQGLQYEPGQIVVTCGAKHAIINTILALCDADDEVLIPSPYWTSFPEQVRFAEATPVILRTDENTEFKIIPEQLREAITPRTKLLILNTPSNPTGAVYTREELAALESVLRETHLFVISDEIYEKIVYDGVEHVSLATFPSLRERVILINGLSKAYAMTGWRLGFLAAQPDIVKAVTKIQSHSTSNPCSISQRAGVAALQGDQSVVQEMVGAFDERRRFLHRALCELPGIRCTLPRGAFYMFPNVSDYFGARWKEQKLDSAQALCSFLLEEEGVAMVPGEAFGSPQHLRISYATSLETLEEAMNRLARGLQKLRGST